MALSRQCHHPLCYYNYYDVLASEITWQRVATDDWLQNPNPFFCIQIAGRSEDHIGKYVWGYIPLTMDIHTACKAGKLYHKNKSGCIHNAQPKNHLSFNLIQLYCKAISFEGTPQTAICDPGLSKCTRKREQKQETLTTHVNVRNVYTNKINSNEKNYLLFHWLYHINSYHKWISICLKLSLHLLHCNTPDCQCHNTECLWGRTLRWCWVLLLCPRTSQTKTKMNEWWLWLSEP